MILATAREIGYLCSGLAQIVTLLVGTQYHHGDLFALV